MEDQLFTLRAYLAAKVISILGDEPCYYFNKREDEGHISAELADPASHVAHLREILDEIDRGVADEGLRRRLTARFYRAEVLSRLTGTQFVNAPHGVPGEPVRRPLGPGPRALRRQRARAWARSRGSVRSSCRSASSPTSSRSPGARRTSRWRRGSPTRGGRTGGSAAISGRPFPAAVESRPSTFVERDDALFLDPSVADDLVGPVDVTDEVSAIRAQVSLVDREHGPGVDRARRCLDALACSPSATRTTRSGCRPWSGSSSSTRSASARASGRSTTARGTSQSGGWAWASQSTGQLRLPHGRWAPTDRPSRRRSSAGPCAGSCPVPDADGCSGFASAGQIAHRRKSTTPARRLVRQGRGITVELPVATDRVGPLASGVLRLTDAAGAISLPAIVRGLARHARRGRESATAGTPAGSVRVDAPTSGARTPRARVGDGVVRDDGQFVILGLRGVVAADAPPIEAAWSVRSARKTSRKRARARLAGFRPGRSRRSDPPTGGSVPERTGPRATLGRMSQGESPPPRPGTRPAAFRPSRCCARA